MLESRAFATSFEFLTIQLVANTRLSSMFPYKRLRNGYHEYQGITICKHFEKIKIRNKLAILSPA